MATIKVNDKDSWNVAFNNGELSIDGVKTGASWDKLDDGRIMLRPDGGSEQYEVELLSFNKEDKTLVIGIGGKQFDVAIKDDLDLLLEKMGMGPGTGAMQNKIKAPMPGMVVDVLVSPGQEVNKDEPLVILEAMKMENVIKSPRDGAIKEIGVEKGVAIEKNHLLIEFEG